MQTTNLFVEQILIGMLTALAGLMLVAPDELHALRSLALSEGVLLVAGVYLLGIVYDRFADTLVEDLEQHQRLLTALGVWKKMRESPKEDPAKEFSPDDVFPEDKLRLKMLENEKLAEYGSYLRSRIRLMRALATLLPALALGLVMVLVDVDARSSYVSVPYFVLATYAITFAWAFTGDKLPRTERLADYQERLRSRGVDLEVDGNLVLRVVLRTRPMVVAIVQTIVATSLLCWLGAATLALLPLVGLAATLLVGWVWWRITSTFHKLLLAMESSAG